MSSSHSVDVAALARMRKENLNGWYLTLALSAASRGTKSNHANPVCSAQHDWSLSAASLHPLESAVSIRFWTFPFSTSFASMHPFKHSWCFLRDRITMDRMIRKLDLFVEVEAYDLRLGRRPAWMLR